MKGFIEVNSNGSQSLNINKILRFYPYEVGLCRSRIRLIDGGTIGCKESYEEIKELIKQAIL